MLVLTRKFSETVELETSDGRITVCVVELRHDRVKLGFDAPESVTVHRSEVADAIRRERGQS